VKTNLALTAEHYGSPARTIIKVHQTGQDPKNQSKHPKRHIKPHQSSSTSASNKQQTHKKATTQLNNLTINKGAIVFAKQQSRPEWTIGTEVSRFL